MEDAVKNHSLFPLETCPHVPDEAFKQFHTIDRELYAVLTHILRRDPVESVQVTAFLMWLEKECCDSTLIKRLTSLPPLLINAVADESALCLKCVESDVFPIGHDGGDEAKILSELLKFPAGVNLRFLHENRIAVIRGVTKIINTVCWRAFGDLFHRSSADVSLREAPPLHGVPPSMYNFPCFDVPMRMPPPPAPMSPHGALQRPAVVADAMGLPMHVAAAGYDVAAQQQILMRMNGGVGRKENVEREVAADDRTIFLTFSKGYPTSEEEIREYFIRKFGDFIEELIMQEVEGEEQPLYAKMVARSVGVIESIVEGNKAKYSINGKHVWARKYVKKPLQQQRSPPKGEPAASSSSSPSSAPKKP